MSPEAVNILIVDDLPANLVSLEALLKQPDYNIIQAESGRDALSLILRHELAVILMDVAMPNLDGFETASIIKERDQSKMIPIIFITASSQAANQVFRAYTIGAVDYLQRPVEPHAVRAKVGVFVELFRRRKRMEEQAARLREAAVREQQLLRERAEVALHESEALYTLTFEEAPVGIGHATPDGRWTNVNRRLLAILGGNREWLLGRRVEMIGEGADETAIARRLAGIRNGGAVLQAEHRLRGQDGHELWGDVTLSAMRAPDGQLQRIIVVVDDVSERKLYELERARVLHDLEDGIRARDDFLSIAAHELRTPITPLRLQSSSMIRDLDEGRGGAMPRLRDRIEMIDRSARRLETLVDQLLEESVHSVETLSLDRQDVDLSRLATEVAGRLHDDAKRAGSPIDVRAEAAMVGYWDRFWLERAITNLLANAIKYGAKQPIEVSVTGDPNIAELVVRDHGVGIPEEAQHRIFERYERVAPVRHFGGFGLGLWTVRRAVEAQGGHVAVWSRPGQGSRFSIALPRRATPQVEVDS